jgi:hypothetical protein
MAMTLLSNYLPQLHFSACGKELVTYWTDQREHELITFWEKTLINQLP